MPNGISKRQQLRNEKTLAELIRTVPGNDRCADCDALTPGWASWNMGIFLCMRCAALHRKLGTHISKVKSLSMDTWSSEQVDNMKSHGNILMNKIYNPKNVKPPVPTDVDEADSCMERYIRQKYQYRSLEDGKPKPPSREDPSYTRSPEQSRRDRSQEGSPPPLPPKTGKLFGFGLRSASSTSNLRRFGSKPKVTSPPSDEESWSPPPPKKSYTTQGLGAPVADVTTASFESKMAAMREMGFTNDRRNEMVLRGLNEDLDRSVQTLARLGEGNQPARARTPATTGNTAPARAVTPKPETSNNPFERAASNPAPQQSQSTSYNPFDRPSQPPASAQPLENSFQNLQVSQPLFPHSTGGYPSQASSIPQAPYQPSFAPSATSTFSQSSFVSSPQSMENSYNPFLQGPSQPQGGVASQPYGVGNQTYPNPSTTQNNPFFSAAPQNPPQAQQPQPTGSVPTLAVPNPPRHANTMPAVSSTSPFGTSPFGTSPFGPTPSFQPQPQSQVPTAGQPYNPFQSATAPTTPQSAGPYPNQFQSHLQPHQPQQLQQPQQLAPQPTGMDKNSILSLYNFAPASSTIPEQPQPQPQFGMGPSPAPPLTSSVTSTPQSQLGSNLPTPQPGIGGAPPTTSRNPYSGAAPTGSGLAAQAGIGSYQPSSGLGIGMGAGTGATATAPLTGLKTATTPFSASPFSSSPFSGPPPSNPGMPRPHMSQPSVDVSGMQNGRHSPDAFASLSARYG
ncbi:hypothetical protein NUU61_005291 [Penicillium alfredii]|uniref:Arf-GAP domain-containing protein n=1 Tax=Penicillium alfredii TaxID=1506179 RepID=A0A9W9F9D1_9EURO|nr:uncharacterized protein NUU61_005291 [Penicillium alfredii]KAJ5095935.1 hypothetical protein NUU61_005291 [Penicillium alfredii]